MYDDCMTEDGTVEDDLEADLEGFESRARPAHAARRADVDDPSFLAEVSAREDELAPLAPPHPR